MFLCNEMHLKVIISCLFSAHLQRKLFTTQIVPNAESCVCNVTCSTQSKELQRTECCVSRQRYEKRFQCASVQRNCLSTYKDIMQREIMQRYCSIHCRRKVCCMFIESKVCCIEYALDFMSCRMNWSIIWYDCKRGLVC